MKKISYILLLAILLLQAGGILFVYIAQQCYVRFEMREALNNRNTKFETITLSLSDYKKSRTNSDEISYKGKMYDVKSVLVSGDHVELLVINDRKEENILTAIKDFIHGDSQPNNGFPHQYHKLQAQKYLAADSDRVFFIPSFSIDFFALSYLKTVSNDSDISTPPPKTV